MAILFSLVSTFFRLLRWGICIPTAYHLAFVFLDSGGLCLSCDSAFSFCLLRGVVIESSPCLDKGILCYGR